MTTNRLAIFVGFMLASAQAAANVTGTITGGTFSAPQPACTGTVVCSGIGTTSLSFGTGSSILTATPSSFDTPLATPFVIGHLFFHNSTNADGSTINSVTLTFNTGDVSDATNPNNNTRLDNIDLNLVFDIVNTPNTGTPADNADIIHFHNPVFRLPGSSTPFDSFHVLEGQETSVEILGALSSFEILGFGKVADPSAGFVSSSIPEPSTLAFLGIGLPVIMARMGRRAAKRVA